MKFSAITFNFVLLSRYDFYFAHDFIVSKKHYHQDPCVQYGFTFMLNEDNLQKPQCFLCSEVLRNGYMKQSKFKQHLQTVNPQNTKDMEAYLKSSKHDFKQEEHPPIMNLLPTRSQHWRHVTVWHCVNISVNYVKKTW
jgi:hypothetical protein